MSPEDFAKYLEEFLKYAKPIYDSTRLYVLSSAIMWSMFWVIMAVVSIIIVRWIYVYARKHWNDDKDEMSDSVINIIVGSIIFSVVGLLSIPAILGYVNVLIAQDFYTIWTIARMFGAAK